MSRDQEALLDNISLRPLSGADVARVCSLHARSFMTLAGGHHEPRQIAAHLGYIAADEYAHELLAANLALAWDGSGRLVGTGGWQPVPERPATARIRKVFVDPAMARRGLGKMLVGAAEERARAAGYVNFFVRANVNAVPLYRALGYRELETGEMVLGGGVALPVVYMEKPG